jgi:hypothetical protein
MLSSLQSFLPQALQQHPPTPRRASPESTSDDDDAQAPASEGPTARRRPTKGSNEVAALDLRAYTRVMLTGMRGRRSSSSGRRRPNRTTR